ncbi:MAG TPA: hypothetical protein VEK79_07105 [Thermoanaerobaculia bacterium]|nr:hypothetical protein [Thermoanaerobaculia bacterium]
MAVPVLWAIYLAILVQPFTSVPVHSASQEAARAHRAAASWGTCFVVYMVAAAWNLVVSRMILKRYMEERFRWATFGLAVLAAALGFSIRETSYASSQAPLSIVVGAGVPIYEVTKVGNAITAAVIILLVATSGALISRGQREEMSARNLRRRIAVSKLSLYSAASLLIIGVVQIYFLNDWPASVFAETTKSSRDGLHDLAYTGAVASGAIYSAVLIMMYAPVLLTHDQWASRLAEDAAVSNPNFDFAKWREAQGLGRSVTGTLSEVGAVVGPWLAAVGAPQLLP